MCGVVSSFKLKLDLSVYLNCSLCLIPFTCVSLYPNYHKRDRGKREGLCQEIRRLINRTLNPTSASSLDSNNGI